MLKNIYTILLISLFMWTTLAAQETVVINDNSIQGNNSYTWTADKEYILDGLVYLEEGGILTIEAGTVIRGKVDGSNGDPISALVIARGAKIYAVGTADAPIIFTAEFDDLSVTDDFVATSNRLWGGLIVLGNAPIGEDPINNAFGEDNVEGIFAENDDRVLYGGTDADDNSGTLKYISIRHGGDEIEADNEINGLTLGGVGRGTEIDYVEVFANKDDGIEIFGGTVNVKHAVVAFQGDDALDFDEAWDGYVQHVFTIQQNEIAIGDNAVEYDGSEESDQDPNPAGRIYNATFIGSDASPTDDMGNATPNSNGARIKKDGALQCWNCVWIDMSGYNFSIESGSIDRYNSGETVFANNVAYNYGNLENDPDNAFEITGVEIVDPQLRSISRTTDGALDPRPSENSPLLTDVATPTESGVEVTNYRGGFNASSNWMVGWTALDAYGYLDATVSTYNVGENKEGVRLQTPMPNPTALNHVVLAFELPSASEITFTLSDLNGRVLRTQKAGAFDTGKNHYTLATTGIANGMYIIAMQTEKGAVTQKLIIQK